MSDEVTKNNEGKPSRSAWELITAYAPAVLAIIGVIGVILYSAGYGVSLSVETQFGIPHSSLFKTSFDLLDLSLWFFLWLINNIGTVAEQMFHEQTYWLSAFSVIFLSLCMWFGIHGLNNLAERRKKKNKKPEVTRTEESKKRRKFFLWTGLVFLLSSAGAILAMPLVLFSMLFISILLGGIPSLSLSAGEARIRDYVISPIHCFPVLTREQRIESLNEKSHVKKTEKEEEKGADCIKVIDDGNEIAKGRVVFNTTGAVVLYEPKTGKVFRIPTEDKIIEVVGSLD